MYRLPPDGFRQRSRAETSRRFRGARGRSTAALRGIARDEVIARDVVAVPPARLDALGTGEQRERPVVLRHCLRSRRAGAAREEPQRARERQPRALRSVPGSPCARRVPGGDPRRDRVRARRSSPRRARRRSISRAMVSACSRRPAAARGCARRAAATARLRARSRSPGDGRARRSSRSRSTVVR